MCAANDPTKPLIIDGKEYGLGGINGISANADTCVPTPNSEPGGNCFTHDDCSPDLIGKDRHFCHSGWNGLYYGPRHCVPIRSISGTESHGGPKGFCTPGYDPGPGYEFLTVNMLAHSGNRCGVGDGDCDSTNQCATGLRCHNDLDNCHFQIKMV